MDASGLSANPICATWPGTSPKAQRGISLNPSRVLDVAHFPERSAEPEIDFILTVGEQRIPMEVKYRTRIGWDDTRGLRSFIEKSVYNAPFGIIVTLTDEPATDDPRIVAYRSRRC